MNSRAASKVYATIRIEDLSKVDFSQVGETSADTIRRNLLTPATQFILKWNTEPDFIADGTVIPDGIYTHEEIIELLSSEVWTPPEPEVE